MGVIPKMPIKKGNVKLTLSINEKILEEYKKYCMEKGMIISKQVENFMISELKQQNSLQFQNSNSRKSSNFVGNKK